MAKPTIALLQSELLRSTQREQWAVERKDEAEKRSEELGLENLNLTTEIDSLRNKVYIAEHALYAHKNAVLEYFIAKADAATATDLKRITDLQKRISGEPTAAGAIRVPGFEGHSGPGF